MTTFPELYGLLMIVGVGLMVISIFTTPRGIYESKDLAKRLEIFTANKGAWTLSAAFGWLSAVLVAAILAGVAYRLKDFAGETLAYAAGAVLLAWALFITFFFFRYAKNPEPMWKAELANKISFFSVVYMVGLLVGTGLTGLVFLEAGMAEWLAYTTIITSAVLLLAWLIFRSKSEFPVYLIFYALVLVIGIVLMRGIA